MTAKILSSLFAGLLISAISAADDIITLKSAQSVRLEVECSSELWTCRDSASLGGCTKPGRKLCSF